MGTTSSSITPNSAGVRYNAGISGWQIPALQRHHLVLQVARTGTIEGPRLHWEIYFTQLLSRVSPPKKVGAVRIV